MLHWSTLGDEQKALLKLIIGHNPLPGSYLAGGTALALLLGHRLSIDFDWFCADKFNTETLSRRLSDIGTFKISDVAKGTLHGFLKEVRVTWLYYPNPMLDGFVTTEEMPGLNLASMLDIAVMKLVALSHRGSAKDFIDLYLLAQNSLDPGRLIQELPRKFPQVELNYYHIIKSLSYFDEAENEPIPKMLIDLNWQSLKRFFLEEQKKLLAMLNQ